MKLGAGDVPCSTPVVKSRTSSRNAIRRWSRASVNGVYCAGVLSSCSAAPLRLATTTPFSMGLGPGCSAISVPLSPMTAIFAPRVGVTANDAIIVAMPPFLKVSVSKKLSSVSASTFLPVAVSTRSGRSVASQPLTEATSPNQYRRPSM